MSLLLLHHLSIRLRTTAITPMHILYHPSMWESLWLPSLHGRARPELPIAGRATAAQPEVAKHTDQGEQGSGSLKHVSLPLC